MEHKAPWLFCWAGEVSAECPGHDLQAGHRPAFSAQPGKVGGAGVLSSPRRLSRSCPHPPASPPHKSPNQSKPWSMKAPWLFCWVGEVSPECPVHDQQAGHRGWDSPHSLERGRGGASRVVPAQTRAAYSLGRIPIGGSFGISDRSDKKSVFYKSVSQPL